MDVQAPFSQDGSPSEGFWEEKDSLWPGITPWPLTRKEPFCAFIVSPLSQKGEQRSLNPLLKQALPFFVIAMTVTLTIAMTITLRCL